MSDNNQNEIKETWKDKVLFALGGLLVFIVFRTLGRIFGISAIVGLFGGYYVYEYIVKTKSAAISLLAGAVSALMIALFIFNILLMLFE